MGLYDPIITLVGAAKFAAKAGASQAVIFTTIKIGDGGGSPTAHTNASTGLVNEVGSYTINRVAQSLVDSTQFFLEVEIPAADGPFTLREISAYDEDGALIVIGNFPDRPKDIPANGVNESMYVRINFQYNNADTVNISTDPSIVMATQHWVSDFSEVQSLISAIQASGTMTDYDFAYENKMDSNLFTGYVGPKSVCVSANGRRIAVALAGTGVTKNTVMVLDYKGFDNYTIYDLITLNAINDDFGFDMDMTADGKTIAIGAGRETVGANFAQGAGYIYRDNGNAFTQLYRYTAPDGDAEDRLGFPASTKIAGSISILQNGKMAVFGDPLNNSEDGRLHVLSEDSAGVWSAVVLTSDAVDSLGDNVKISNNGKTIAASGIKYDGASSRTGSVVIFEKSANWAQEARLIATTPALSKKFGSGVNLSAKGNTVVITTPADDMFSIFKRTSGVWANVLDEVVGSSLGIVETGRIRISVDEKTIIISATAETVGAVTNNGVFLVYRENNGWSESQRVVPNGSNNLYGSIFMNISLDSNLIAIINSAKEVILHRRIH